MFPGVPPRTGDTTPAGCNFEKDRDVDTIEVARVWLSAYWRSAAKHRMS